MLIDRQEHEVNRLEMVNGKLVDFGKVTCHETTIKAYHTCNTEDYLDSLILDLQELLEQLYQKRDDRKGRSL